MNYTEFRNLLSQAASHLAGVSVLVRLEEPAVDMASGQCYKVNEHMAVIDIHPALDYDAMFRVFCHEAAHLALDFARIPGGAARGKGSVTRSQADRAAWQVNPMETRANNLGSRWEKYAKSKIYDIYLPPDQPAIVGWLKALSTMPQSELPNKRKGLK
jgi:hypothetical protein